MKINSNHRRLTILTVLFSATLFLQAWSNSNSGRSTTSEYIRGLVRSVDGGVLTVETSAGAVRVQLASSAPVATIVPSDPTHIRDGSYLGMTSVMESDGSQRAVEVHVFAEAMRGAGEGSFGWDWPGASQNSRMTNGTASKMSNGTAVASKMTNGTVSRSKIPTEL